jgi:hypothetical protein
MVLYEGARIHHGRPMRLKGQEFGKRLIYVFHLCRMLKCSHHGFTGNIFTHFAPLDWKGPARAKSNNPYFDRELRAKHHEVDHDEM